MSDYQHLFEPPDQDKLDKRAADLTLRANLVRRHGWADYRQLWSYGEVLGVALVLGDSAELQRRNETTTSALDRWSFDLWGIARGQADTYAGLPRTRAWFDAVRAGVDAPVNQRPQVTR